MNPLRPVQPAAVVAALTTRASRTYGQVPVADIADRATTAWHHGHHDQACVDRRREAGTVAVVDDIYPVGFTAGRGASAAAVAGYVTTAATEATATLRPEDPGASVAREILDRLTEAAASEAQRGSDPSANDHPPVPWPRTFIEASSGFGAQSDADRIAHAAAVAWNHGFEDGWTEGYWVANRIVNSVRHDERAATTTIAGTPALVWLDNLAEAARDISRDKPSGHPARLARLAGAEPAAGADLRRTTPSSPQTPPRDDTVDKRHGRPRGM